ncbi:MAG TPA: HAD family hydrolase [Terriglobales bacterium]|jgi:sugar-phosphatase
MKTFSCAAILFDLDGVLVDSTRSVVRQWHRWAKENALDPDEVAAVAHGVRTIEVVRRMAPHLDAKAEALALEQREAVDYEGVEVMPGAAELLQSIPDGKWCVVTSGMRMLALSRLQIGRLPVPKVMVSADEVTNGKPHPEPYLKGAQLLGVNPEECLVVEDAPAGIRSAHAGKMKAIGITSTYAARDLDEADAVIQRLTQIRVSSGREGKLAVNVE